MTLFVVTAVEIETSERIVVATIEASSPEAAIRYAKSFCGETCRSFIAARAERGCE